jgi:DNA-binding MarR family transcriptional regulator
MKKAGAPRNLELAVVALSLAIGQLRRRLKAEASPEELNLSQLGALVRLEQTAWLTGAELARAESVRPQSMNGVLKGLEEQGLVLRRPHPTDGRQIQYALTALGYETRHRRLLAKRDWLVGALGKLSPDEQAVLRDAIPLIKRLGEI